MRQLLPPGALGLLGLTAQAVFLLTLGALGLSLKLRFLLLTQPLFFHALTLGLLTRTALLSRTLLRCGGGRLLTALFLLGALLGSGTPPASLLRLGNLIQFERRK